jgi:hypothetical protein
MQIKSPPPAPSQASALLNELQICESLKAALGLRCDVRTGEFLFRASGRPTGEKISELALLAVISSTLAAQPELFPASQLRPRRLKRIISVLRALCADAGEDAHRLLEQFVQTRLALRPGEDLSSGEIHDAYAKDSARRGTITINKYDFHRRLPGLIRNAFGLTQSHQGLRPAPAGRLTMRRGWRGLILKDSEDDTDAEDVKLVFRPAPDPNHELIQL